MIFSILAHALFMAVFVLANVAIDTVKDITLTITLHADAAAGIPTVDRNGNKWSVEQLRVLRAFAKAIWEHKNGGKPISIAVSAVAGSGKTSLLQGMTHIVAKLAPELLTAMTAFNTHIAASSKDILIQFKSTDGLNIKIFGGRNTVNAGGRGMLLTKAKAEGFSDIDFPSYGNDRYARLARLTLAGWLARGTSSKGPAKDDSKPRTWIQPDDKPLPAWKPELGRLNLLERARVAMEVATTSHAFNNMIGDGLVKACNIAMDEGYVPSATVRSNVPSPYVPPTPADEDVKALATVIHRVGVNQSWDENPARNLGDRAVFELVVEILAVAIETAFMKVDLKPFCGEGKSFMDAYVPFKKADRRGGFEKWQPIAPVRKQIFTTDPDIIKKAQFAILENGGCRFPPASKDGKGGKAGVKAISFDTEAKAIVKHHDGVIVMSFENDGHVRRLGGKGIGTQFGFNGDYTVNGERISKWRKYVGSKGYTMVHPEHLGKVIALLTEVFGDEFHNMLDEGTYEDVQHEVVEAGKGTLVLSMADMIYLPHALDLQVPIHERADVVFIDEVQDLSVLKANLVWRLAKEDAHKVIVGDLRQAIYLFAGASAQSFEDNAKNINAEFFPQTICWRGTEMVAASARLACRRFTAVARDYWPNLTTPDYDAHRSPLEAGYDWDMGAMPVQITPNELIKAYHKSRQLHGEDTTFGLLCRVKKPLAGYILQFIKNGIGVSTPATVGDSNGLIDEAFTIANKDRIKFLDKSFQKVGGRAIIGLGWKAMPASKISQHSLLLRDLENVKKAIVSKYTDMFKGDTKSMAQSTEFQEQMGNVELLEAFVSLHRTKGGNDEVKGKNLSSALQTWVEEALFTERGGAAVHIASLHRYKGDEADIMFIVNEMLVEDEDGNEKAMSCFMSNRSCEASPESAVNEISMGYVAFTRAKKQNIIINVDLQGEVCSDVEQRLQAAFDRDVEALTTNAVQEPQDTPESDSGATDEDTADLDRCVECSTIIAEGEEYGTCSKCGGHLCRERMPDHHTNAGDVSDLASCGSYVGNISLDEMMNGDEATLEAKRTCTACSDDEKPGGKEATDEQQPTLPKVLPSPVVIMKRDWSKVSKRSGNRTGELTQKLHIDANPDEPTGESLCGKRFSIHPTLNTPKGEYMAGKFTGGSRTPEPSHQSTEIGIARRYHVHYGYGYNAGSRTCYTVLTDEEDHYCQRCVAKWKKQHGMGIFSPVDSLAAVQHGLLHQLPMEFSFRDGRETTYGSIEVRRPRINDDGTRSTGRGITLAHFATKEENVLIKPERWDHYDGKGISWGDRERLKHTTFQFEIEVQEMIDAGRLSWNDKGSLAIPFADELLKDVDCTDLEGEVADFVAEFLDRYMVARCFEPETQERIQEDWPHATVWDKMFNRMKNVKDEIKSKDSATTQWKKDFDPSLPHTLKEWEALPMKEDA